MKKIAVIAIGVVLAVGAYGRAAQFDVRETAPLAAGWTLAADGGIERLNPGEMSDHYEMSARGVDAIVEWSVSATGAWSRVGVIRFPTLRGPKDDTHDSWAIRFDDDSGKDVKVDGRALSRGTVVRVAIRETLKVEIGHPDEGLSEVREVFPALNARALLERVTIENVSRGLRTVEVLESDRRESLVGKLGEIRYHAFIAGAGVRRLAPGAKLEYVRVATGRGTADPLYYPDANAELAARGALWREVTDALRLETPSAEIDAMFAFAKFRTLESLYFTRGGMVHSPGGYNSYLASIWANDQAEYACPLLPYLGAPVAVETMKNCFRWFAAWTNANYRPIPCSIIAEGRGMWNRAGDRGDQAMIAHGAARAALTLGDRAFAAEMKPLVDWCLEFGRRKLLPEGVIASDRDELEGRLPAGKANLCTSSLHYDALLRAADLADALGADGAADLRARAARLDASMERYFGGEVEGFDVYRYYEGNDRLRSWIAIPLCFGIDRRAEAVSKAVFSKRLWDGVGLKSVSGDSTFWDRSTLYAFRGLCFAGRSDDVLPHLAAYTRERLLGAHVPYAVEAFPEGNKSQLAAESALYARIFTEGVFGIVPRGLDGFSVRPNLPSAWPAAALRGVRSCGADFDLELRREDGGTRVTVLEGEPRRAVFTQVVPKGGDCLVTALSFMSPS